MLLFMKAVLAMMTSMAAASWALDIGNSTKVPRVVEKTFEQSNQLGLLVEHRRRPWHETDEDRRGTQRTDTALTFRKLILVESQHCVCVPCLCWFRAVAFYEEKKTC